MRLLLDTHTFIWFAIDSPKFSVLAKTLIEDENNEKLVSIASFWEMAIKESKGKLNLIFPLRVFIDQQLRLNSMDVLNVNLDYLEVVSALPLHHSDPFDRLLISQAIVEQIPILSADAAFDGYPIQRLW